MAVTVLKLAEWCLENGGVALLALAGAYLSYLFFLIFIYPLYYYRTLFRFPGPKRRFFTGTVHELGVGPDIISKLDRQMQQFKGRDYVHWYGPAKPVVFVMAEDSLQKILAGSVPKGWTYSFLMPWLGTGLLTANGQQWQAKRKMLTPAFHFDILKEYMLKFQTHTRTLVSKLDKAAHTGERVELLNYMSLATLDVIADCAMGVQFHAQEQPSSPYIAAVNDASTLILKRLNNPLVYNDFLYSLTPDGMRWRRALNIMHNTTAKVIQERKMQLLHGTESSRRDFLAILLNARYEDGSALSDKELRDEVDTFLFEGHDTTAAGLLWTLFCLAKYPQIADHCKEEIDAVLRDQECPSFDDLDRLVYTQACIKESLRLYPPVPSIARELSKPMELSGVVVPAGVEIAINPYSIHRNPALWTQPELFDPSRFLSASVEKTHAFSYVPFSAGSRNCIGKRFAMMELTTVVACVTRRFRLRLLNEDRVRPSPALITRTEEGVWVAVERR